MTTDYHWLTLGDPSMNKFKSFLLIIVFFAVFLTYLRTDRYVSDVKESATGIGTSTDNNLITTEHSPSPRVSGQNQESRAAISTPDNISSRRFLVATQPLHGPINIPDD